MTNKEVILKRLEKKAKRLNIRIMRAERRGFDVVADMDLQDIEKMFNEKAVRGLMLTSKKGKKDDWKNANADLMRVRTNYRYDKDGRAKDRKELTLKQLQAIENRLDHSLMDMSEQGRPRLTQRTTKRGAEMRKIYKGLLNNMKSDLSEVLGVGVDSLDDKLLTDLDREKRNLQARANRRERAMINEGESERDIKREIALYLDKESQKIENRMLKKYDVGQIIYDRVLKLTDKAVSLDVVRDYYNATKMWYWELLESQYDSVEIIESMEIYKNNDMVNTYVYTSRAGIVYEGYEAFIVEYAESLTSEEKREVNLSLWVGRKVKALQLADIENQRTLY